MKLTFTGLLATALMLILQTSLFAQTQQTPPDEAVVYEYAEQMPAFKGGESAMMTYLSGSIPYTNTGVTGLVVVSFVVDDDGTIDEVKVLKSLHPSLDSVSVQAVRNMNGYWTPGVQKGKPVKVRFTLPIKFSHNAGSAPKEKASSQEMPEYKGGTEAFVKFMKRNVRYPQQATKRGVVYVSFTINEDGSLTDYEIEKSVEPVLDREAMRLAKLSDGNWLPGVRNGEKVKVKYTMPVIF